jgi:hypothetical protein
MTSSPALPADELETARIIAALFLRMLSDDEIVCGDVLMEPAGACGEMGMEAVGADWADKADGADGADGADKDAAGFTRAERLPDLDTDAGEPPPRDFGDRGVGEDAHDELDPLTPPREPWLFAWAAPATAIFVNEPERDRETGLC